MTRDSVHTNGSRSYRLLEQPNPFCAEVEFEGVFEHHAVRWRATLHALIQATDQGHDAPRQYIEIDPAGPSAAGVLKVKIGLAVTAIDPPTIHKTMIMMRQYKRLRRGRMEFGPTRVPHTGTP